MAWQQQHFCKRVLNIIIRREKFPQNTSNAIWLVGTSQLNLNFHRFLRPCRCHWMTGVLFVTYHHTTDWSWRARQWRKLEQIKTSHYPLNSGGARNQVGARLSVYSATHRYLQYSIASRAQVWTRLLFDRLQPAKAPALRCHVNCRVQLQ